MCNHSSDTLCTRTHCLQKSHCPLGRAGESPEDSRAVVSCFQSPGKGNRSWTNSVSQTP